MTHSMADETAMLREARRRCAAILQTLRRRRAEFERAPGLSGSSRAEGIESLDCMVDSAARLLESIDKCLKQCGISPDNASDESARP